MKRDEAGELRWLAFRYVSDELTAAEAEAFECRLDDDQSAREAVAEAVALTTAVASLPADALNRLPMKPRMRPAVRVLAQVLVAYAACTVAILGVELWPALVNPLHVPKVTSERTTPDVVLAWTDLREDTDAVEARAGLMAWLDGPSPLDSSEAADGMPDWLMEAATLPVAKEN